jgi:hypothetical protein
MSLIKIINIIRTKIDANIVINIVFCGGVAVGCAGGGDTTINLGVVSDGVG